MRGRPRLPPALEIVPFFNVKACPTLQFHHQRSPRPAVILARMAARSAAF